jgi:hypothetical protein
LPDMQAALRPSSLYPTIIGSPRCPANWCLCQDL